MSNTWPKIRNNCYVCVSQIKQNEKNSRLLRLLFLIQFASLPFNLIVVHCTLYSYSHLDFDFINFIHTKHMFLESGLWTLVNKHKTLNEIECWMCIRSVTKTITSDTKSHFRLLHNSDLIIPLPTIPLQKPLNRLFGCSMCIFHITTSCAGLQ